MQVPSRKFPIRRKTTLQNSLNSLATAEIVHSNDCTKNSGRARAVNRPLDETSVFDDDRSHPTDVGPYRVQRLLGEGGMGIVYLAEQFEPVHRSVAVKIIKPGMDTRAVIARFETERQALALMNHVNISRVIDAGTSAQGLPYFVMEYVQGLPLTKYCDRKRLSTRDRLDLFLQVCDGIQHAHQKGIIHRDIKPSNILVAEMDEKPIPKIIDFGLAKATQQRLTEKTLYTAQGVFLGTPAYMSPEQADSEGVDVDTRTDVYALGVTLYELLVGRLPFQVDATTLGSLAEVRRLICEDDPPRPSTRATTHGDDAKDVAKRRATEPAALTKMLKGDLDWILLKTLEKDPNRRYATAAEFRADIVRYLRLEPVAASPPSHSYRFKKLIRRHAAAVVVAAGFLLFLIAASVVSTALYFTAEAARKDAVDSKQQAETNLLLAESETRRAAQKEIEARTARQEAENQRDEVLRLADVQRVGEYREEAEKLWPAYPENLPGLSEWLAQATDLAMRLEGHRLALENLRKKATPGKEPDSYVFPDDAENQWRHDTLTELVSGLMVLTHEDPRVGAIASIKERINTAQTIRKATIDDHQEAWDEAIAFIQDVEECPVYQGLELVPQIDLIPIGQDPESGLWEFVHHQTGEIPERDEDGELSIEHTMGLIFVLIPGGTSFMGSQAKSATEPNFDPATEGDETPVHEITLAPYFLSKFEMTQFQWEKLTGETPSFTGPKEFNPSWSRRRKPRLRLHPVEQISWEDCKRVLVQVGLDLPTEAQWEYAARAGTGTRYWCGEDAASLDGAANIADEFAKAHGGPAGWFFEVGIDDGETIHGPIGQYRPNPFGLHDMIGNVFEWCLDRHSGYTIVPTEGAGERSNAANSTRIYRGGSFANLAIEARSADRASAAPDNRAGERGVRPARAISPRE